MKLDRLKVLIEKKYAALSGYIHGRSDHVSSADLVNVGLTRKVYIDAQHGLGNRLRAIASAASIAASEKRELVIVWEPDFHCECTFNDLFDYSDTVLGKSLISEIEGDSVDIYNYMEIEEGAIKDQPVVIDASKDLYFRSAYILNSPLSNLEVENNFLRNLTLSEGVRELVRSINIDNHIAVHIRMEGSRGTDNKVYDSIENWTKEGHDKINYWREKSHYSNFVKRIDEMIDHDVNLKIFLAADQPETYEVFDQYYGSRVTYLERDLFDRSKDQIKYALADVVLLSRCRYLLGSYWSSFTELAQRLSCTFEYAEMSGKDF